MDKEILDYAKARYEEEQLRLEQIENKCGRLFPLITFLIGAVAGLASFKNTDLFNPVNALDYLIVFGGSATLICLFYSWGYALLSIKLDIMKVAPGNQETIDYFRGVTPDQAHDHIFNCYMDTRMLLIPITDDKARNLKRSYGGLAVAGFLMALTIALIALQGFLK